VCSHVTRIGLGAFNKAKDVFLGEFKKETTKEFAERFSALDIVAASSEGRMSVHARYKRLEERVVQASDQVRFNRAETRTLFSARHFAAFFRHACDHFARNPREPFDFVKASRLRNPVSVDLDKHLSNFLKNIKSPHELTEFAVPVISSSFLLDHYPPDMHGMRVSRFDMALEDLTSITFCHGDQIPYLLHICYRTILKLSAFHIGG
jgi:hypothetical protein